MFERCAQSVLVGSESDLERVAELAGV